MATKQSTLERLTNSNNSLFQYLEEIKNWEFNIPDEPNSWNIEQVLMHLYTLESLSMKYLSYKMDKDPTFENASWWTIVKFELFKLKAEITPKMKAPKVVNIKKQDVTMSIPEIIDAWIDIRKKLTRLIENLDDNYFNKAMYKHPVARLTLDQMVRFFDYHIGRHKKQITKLRII